MNKKQASIILTLIALIVCVGVLAAKVNESTASLTSMDSPSEVKEKEKDEKTSDVKDKESNKSKDYFYESKNEREQTDSQTIQTYKSIIEDKNTSKEKKDETTKKLNDLTTARNYETRIEVSIKSKGFEDALCLMESDNKVRLIVKSKEQLTEKQTIQIQESVHAVAKTKDVIIEVKQ